MSMLASGVSTHLYRQFRLKWFFYRARLLYVRVTSSPLSKSSSMCVSMKSISNFTFCLLWCHAYRPAITQEVKATVYRPSVTGCECNEQVWRSVVANIRNCILSVRYMWRGLPVYEDGEIASLPMSVKLCLANERILQSKAWCVQT